METATVLTSSVLAMSTKEISDLTGKRHDHVLRDTKVMLAGIYGEEVCPSFEKHSPNLGNEQVQGVTWTRCLSTHTPTL